MKANINKQEQKADELQHLLDVSEKEYKKLYYNGRNGWVS